MVWKDDDSAEPVFLPMSRGQEISWTISGPRRCVGTRERDGRLVRCPEHSTTRRGLSRCGPCQALDEMRPCILCDGTECRANDERRIKCDATTYAVYLAVFGNSLMKVGVSSINRVMTRWVEQGADMAAILGEITGGKRARQIEDRISRSGPFTKAVRGQTKGRFLSTKIDVEEVTRLVYSSLTEEFARHYLKDYGVNIPLWPPTLVDLAPHYDLHQLDSSAHYLSTRSLSSAQRLRVTGHVVGMKGPLLVLSQGTNFMLVDTRGLAGYTIIEDHEHAQDMLVQAALAEFL